jgi:hypothetical protein
MEDSKEQYYVEISGQHGSYEGFTSRSMVMVS